MQIFFLTLDDEEVTNKLEIMSNSNLATTASGGAGIAAAMNGEVSKLLKMNSDSKTLCFLSEVAE